MVVPPRHFMVFWVALLAAVLYPWSKLEAGSTELDGQTFIVKSGFLGEVSGKRG